jgi:hypothetical protein
MTFYSRGGIVTRPFSHSQFVTVFVTRLTRRVPLVLPEHLSSPPVFSGVHVTRSLVLYVCFVDRCLFFCTFHSAIVLSVLLRYMDSDYPFGIFKLFLKINTYAIFVYIFAINFVSKQHLDFKRHTSWSDHVRQVEVRSDFSLC